MFIIIKLLYQILNNKYCNRHEVERQTVEELRNNISLLEHEKREKAVDRLRYEKEIELLEENWKKESQELLVMITRLQEENKKLSLSLRERDEKIITKSISTVIISLNSLIIIFVLYFQAQRKGNLTGICLKNSGKPTRSNENN